MTSAVEHTNSKRGLAMPPHANPWQFSLKSLLLTVLGICVMCAAILYLRRMAVTPADAGRFEAVIGILISLLTLMICIAPFAYFGFVLSNRNISACGIAGSLGGFALAFLLVSLSVPDWYPSQPWSVVGYEYLEHGDLRIPRGIIAPITLLGGLAALGCRRLVGVRRTAQR